MVEWSGPGHRICRSEPREGQLISVYRPSRRAGDRVMEMPESKNDKAEENAKPKRPKKPLEYRRFEKMLKQVVKAPPLRKSTQAPKIDSTESR
jgi:hypothetical protein